MISQDAMDTHIPGDLIGISLLMNILGKRPYLLQVVILSHLKHCASVLNGSLCRGMAKSVENAGSGRDV